MPQPPGDLHPDPGMPGSQVATVLGRTSFRKPISFFLFLFLPAAADMTVFQMGNNQSTSWQTPLRCILDNWMTLNILGSFFFFFNFYFFLICGGFCHTLK